MADRSAKNHAIWDLKVEPGKEMDDVESEVAKKTDFILTYSQLLTRSNLD